ncbi:MAG: hypothetical protein ACFCVK_21285 [Acidimicrobiales bacterium]
MARRSINDHEADGICRVRTARPPWRFSRTPERLLTGAGRLGAQTGEILSELGYDPAAVAELGRTGVLPDRTSPPCRIRPSTDCRAASGRPYRRSPQGATIGRRWMTGGG